MNREKISEALRHLRRADPVMREVIRRAGPFRLKPRRDRFYSLVSSILSQQISGNAAAAIKARVEQFVTPETIAPESLGRLTPRQFRKLGVSPQKTIYLMDRRARPHGRAATRAARANDRRQSD